jgi:hypothetical protein
MCYIRNQKCNYSSALRVYFKKTPDEERELQLILLVKKFQQEHLTMGIENAGHEMELLCHYVMDTVWHNTN